MKLDDMTKYTVDERALDVIEEWGYIESETATQRKAALQIIIVGALKEQNRLTRKVCGEVALGVTRKEQFFKSEVREACNSVTTEMTG